MKEISEYVSYEELCQLSAKDEEFTSKILLEYSISENQWYLKYGKRNKKIKKETMERYLSNHNLKIINQSKIKNVLNKAS